MKIYLDVLFITNFIITLMYVKGLSAMTHTFISKRRAAAVGVFGGISSIIIVARPDSFFYAALISVIKIAASIITIIIAVGAIGIKRIIRYFFLYLAMNFVFAGCCVLLWEITGSKIIYIKNCTVYLDISLVDLMISVILAYIVIIVYDKIKEKGFARSQSYKARYSVGDYEITISAIADSGNTLCDSFTGIPVVVFYSNELFEHFDLDYENIFTLNGFRLVPCTTINGSSLLPVTAKGTVEIIDKNNFSKTVKCYTGVARSGNNRSRAIFNPVLLT
ncbi:MAG: sigma-E processing peptidase SpoIIGA [Oscillospiraceae bacterium]